MPPVIPRATYRLQFHKHFGFDRATELAPYLARLGVSHLYASSYLKARPGSTQATTSSTMTRSTRSLGMRLRSTG